MAVRIRLFSTLVALSNTKEPQFEIPWLDGMRVADVVAEEGFSEQDAEAIAAIVNGEQALFEQVLADGDEVEFIVNLQGGAAWRPARAVTCPAEMGKRWIRAEFVDTLAGRS